MQRIQPVSSSTPPPPSPFRDSLRNSFLNSPAAADEPEPGIAAPGASRPSRISRVIETTAESLWAILLFLVIGFLVSKAPTISAVFDEAANAFRRGGEPAVRVNEAQIQDLELRMAAEERKLSTLERGYAQLKERHADLLRAYADLQENRKATPGESVPLRAAN